VSVLAGAVTLVPASDPDPGGDDVGRLDGTEFGAVPDGARGDAGRGGIVVVLDAWWPVSSHATQAIAIANTTGIRRAPGIATALIDPA
jgi:hypothetical protein